MKTLYENETILWHFFSRKIWYVLSLLRKNSFSHKKENIFLIKINDFIAFFNDHDRYILKYISGKTFR